MAKLADRVKETTTTTGTGTYSLAGPATGYRGFVAGVGDGAVCHYCVTDGIDWEVGTGTVDDATPDTLTRDTIIASSNGGAAVNWSAGTKEAFLTMPAPALEGEPVDTTVTGTWVTNTTYTFKSYRRGKHLVVDGNIVLAGAPTTATLALDVPLSLVVDEAALPGTTANNAIGFGWIRDNSANIQGLVIVHYSEAGNTINFLAHGTTATMQAITQAAPFTWAANDVIAIHFELPILGW